MKGNWRHVKTIIGGVVPQLVTSIHIKCAAVTSQPNWGDLRCLVPCEPERKCLLTEINHIHKYYSQRLPQPTLLSQRGQMWHLVAFTVYSIIFCEENQHNAVKTSFLCVFCLQPSWAFLNTFHLLTCTIYDYWEIPNPVQTGLCFPLAKYEGMTWCRLLKAKISHMEPLKMINLQGRVNKGLRNVYAPPLLGRWRHFSILDSNGAKCPQTLVEVEDILSREIVFTVWGKLITGSTLISRYCLRINCIFREVTESDGSSRPDKSGHTERSIELCR